MTNAVSEHGDIIVQNDLGRRKATIKVGGGDERMIELGTGVWSYGAIVSALVRSKYSEDEVEAIVSNGLMLMATPSAVSAEDAEEKQKEFAAFTEWREKCKARAKELLELGEEMGMNL